MVVTHTRSGKKLRLSSSHKLFGRDRETIDEAYPGDVVGLVGHAEFGIGDTLAEDPTLVYREIPRFAPECFAFLQSPSTAQFKRFREGLGQLLQEGVVQAFTIRDSLQRVPLLGAVGPLQFEVVQYRLQSEYGAESRLESAVWKVIRWVASKDAERLDPAGLPTGAALASDAASNLVVLFSDQWSCDFYSERNQGLRLSTLPPEAEAIFEKHVATAGGSLS
jgi:peptide chain release factor 3